MNPVLGVLGGMGPLATVDFLHKLIQETPARCDAEHIPVIVYSKPQVPDRTAAIVAGGISPLPEMAKGIRTLKISGARAVAIPCNTAHYWYDALVSEGGLPILHIADSACDELAARRPGPGTVGLIATQGTLSGGFFQQRLAARGYECISGTESDRRNLVERAIECVKRNDLGEAHGLALRAVQNLRDRGAQAVILACTEIPVAIDYGPNEISAFCIDTTRALARACVRWWQSASAGIIRRQATHNADGSALRV